MKKLLFLIVLLAMNTGVFAATSTNDLEFLAKSILSEKKLMDMMDAQFKRMPKEMSANLPPGFSAEFLKAIKPKYPEMIKLIMTNIQETYTPEQIAILVEFHKKNPWAGDKTYDLMDKMSPVFAKLGTEVGGKVLEEMTKAAAATNEKK